MSRCRVDKFNMAAMKPDCVIAILGKRNTGKTTLITDIMWHMQRKWDMVMGFAGSIASHQSMLEYMPPAFVYTDYSHEVVAKWVDVANDLRLNGKRRQFCCLLDDCTFDKKVLHGTTIRKIFMNGRHFRMAFILAMQYMMDMGPELRCQVDYVFALKEVIMANKKRLWQYFFGIFDHFSDFCKVLEECTNDYECLVLNNRVSSNNMEDCIFWYKANPCLGSFRTSSGVFWRLAYKYRVDKNRRRRRKGQHRLRTAGKTINEVQKGTVDGRIQESILRA